MGFFERNIICLKKKLFVSKNEFLKSFSSGKILDLCMSIA